MENKIRSKCVIKGADYKTEPALEFAYDLLEAAQEAIETDNNWQAALNLSQIAANVAIVVSASADMALAERPY